MSRAQALVTECCEHLSYRPLVGAAMPIEFG